MILGRPRPFFLGAMTATGAGRHVEVDAMEAREEHVDENLRDFLTPFVVDDVNFVTELT